MKRNHIDHNASRTRFRKECRDQEVPMQGREKSERILLGLTLLSMAALPGARFSRDDIAAWAGCTEATIQQIEQAALRKLRNRLVFMKDPILTELIEGLFEERGPAQRSYPHADE